MATTGPRSVADVVRGLDRTELATLLRLRPDLARPRPTTLTEVIERAATPASTRAAIDALDAWQRRVAEALAAMPEAISARKLAALLAADRSAVDAAVKALRQRVLVWGDDRSLRLTQGARSCFGPTPAGLAGPSATPLDDTTIDERRRGLGADEVAILDRLTWGPPTGRVPGAERVTSPEAARTPAERLLGLRLLRAVDSETAILPREVALRLRGGHLFPDEVPTRVPAWPAGADHAISESAAQGSAVAALGLLTTVVTEIERLAPRPLASGGIPRRDLVTIGRETGADNRIGWYVALASQLGLVAGSATAWLPTARFDEWSRGSTFERWRSMVNVWLELRGWPLGSATAAREDGPERGRLAGVAELRLAPVGALVDREALEARLRWRHPDWPETEAALAATGVIAEAAELGVVALGRRTSLLDATEDPGFPQPGDRVMVQSDLTAVAPGPLTLEVSRTLDLLGEREAPGPASVHRFTASSLRRALDLGWDADAVLAWLGEHSITPIPQALNYLVADVARQHGRIRVASVASLLTIDDPATLEGVLRHPRAGELGLRRVAPGILSAQAEPADVVDLLRELGHAPIAEDASGSAVHTPAARRLRVHPPAPRQSPPSRDQLLQLAADLLNPSADARPTNDAAALVETLVGAQTSGSWVSVAHVDDQGSRRTDRARVLAVVSGRVRLVAKGKGQFVVPLSRIVSAVPAS